MFVACPTLLHKSFAPNQILPQQCPLFPPRIPQYRALMEDNRTFRQLPLDEINIEDHVKVWLEVWHLQPLANSYMFGQHPNLLVCMYEPLVCCLYEPHLAYPHRSRHPSQLFTTLMGLSMLFATTLFLAASSRLDCDNRMQGVVANITLFLPVVYRAALVEQFIIASLQPCPARRRPPLAP